MKNYITIDGGTTNTRVVLVINGDAVDTIKLNVGARAGIDDKKLLKNSVADAIRDILARNNLAKADIARILACGMITSEFGLYELVHTETPVGIDELKQCMCEVSLPEISSIPFVFMRGVKTKDGKGALPDMMRGEETELMGIMGEGDGSCMYVLPGSHSKLIKTDATGKITDFTTMLTGEMIASLAGGTILKSAVDLSCDTVDEQYLIKGFEYCLEKGINDALFKVRILKNLLKCTAEQVYSFFLGIVLCDEISAILKSGVKNVVIGGKRQIKRATAILLKAKSKLNVTQVSDKDVDLSTVRGMIRIYEH